jgi:hypothetical protein
MERLLQMFGAEVFTTHHTITQDAYGKSVASVEVAEPHWLIHGVWILQSWKHKKSELLQDQDACVRRKISGDAVKRV